MHYLRNCSLTLLAAILLLASPHARSAPEAALLDFALRSAVADGGFYGSTGRTFNLSKNGIETWRLDLEYRSRINDRYQLIWSPLPLGILYLLRNEPNFK